MKGKVDIGELTLREIREIASLVKGDSCSKSHSFEIGQVYFIRSVTHYYIGRLVSVTDTDLVLSDASWIPCTARFHNFLKEGKQNEVEPFVDDVIVARGGIIDATLYQQAIPRTQK